MRSASPAFHSLSGVEDVYKRQQEYSSDKSFTNYVTGANIAGFVKVADSMIDQGVV